MFLLGPKEVSMYGNGTVIISLKLNSVLSLYFLNEDNLWILQVTYIPLILTSVLLHLFIMNFMWKNGKLKQPIDKLFFMDLAASLFFMLIMLLNKNFYSNLSRHDPWKISVSLTVLLRTAVVMFTDFQARWMLSWGVDLLST